MRTLTDGPSVVDDLEDRLVRTKTHLSRFPTSKDNGTLCGSSVPSVGVGGGKDRRSVRYGQSRRSGRLDEEGLKRLPVSEDNGTFVDLPSYLKRWVGSENIGLLSAGNLEG